MIAAVNFMDLNELRKLSEEVARALDKEGAPLFELKLALGRIISHLESEQRVTVRMEKQIDFMEKKLTHYDDVLYGDKDNPSEKPGLVAVCAKIRSGQKNATKLLWLIAAAVLGPALIGAARWIISHI